ncbi:MAG: hypothetical protein NXI31_26430 [bacterium]|nr:hypothetical protein [bacterium]
MTTNAQILQRSFPVRVVCTLVAVLTGILLVLVWSGYSGFLGALGDGTPIAIVFAGALIARCVLELRRDYD